MLGSKGLRRNTLFERAVGSRPRAEFASVKLGSGLSQQSLGRRQGIFLHIDCVPFWDAAPIHWDAAPTDFQSLRPKRKACCHVMSAFLCTMSRLPQHSPRSPFLCPVVRSAQLSALSRSRSRASPCLTMHCVLYCVVHCPLYCPALSSPVLSCPAPVLSCPVQPCPALPCSALPCPALLCPALPCPAVALPLPQPAPAPDFAPVLLMPLPCPCHCPHPALL